MPKILENIRENLLQEARKQVMEQGYSLMTIRSVASACGVGVGTVYNYFPSKDNLVANFMLEDWQKCLGEMQGCCGKADNPKSALRGVYDALRSFMDTYDALFEDEHADVSFKASFHPRHKQLRSQIAKPLKPFCMTQKAADPHFLSELLAEAMLCWTLDGRRFEEISSVLLQLF